MEQGSDYTNILNRAITVFFKDAVRITLSNPSKALFFLRTMWWQKRAAQKRQRWLRENLHVPPFLIMSVTNKCNLRCKGCVAFAHQGSRPAARELSEDRLRDLISEAHQLGVSGIILAGGEPLVRKELLSITKDFPAIVFPLITNGTLIDETVIQQLKGQQNIIPLISIEGNEYDTDERRGAGIHKRLQGIMKNMRAEGIFFGCSLTLTRSNAATITDTNFVKNLIEAGTRLLLLLEYVSFEEGTDDWVLTDEQRSHLRQKIEAFRAQLPALFIAIPGDEEQYGGCLAAGRGFVHISAGGDVEPCPATPFSDASVATVSLKEALQSHFLQTIRQQHDSLNETEGGCVLWTEREWVRSLLLPKDSVIIPVRPLGSKNQ
ncbi:MAG: radical SAM protein [Euryarchaeota archaeon]|nr:radical SAM protein [Euryarchaeota archaeon]